MLKPSHCLGGLLLVGVLNGCSGQVEAPPLNVILICIDTLRADHLGCYGHSANPSSPTLDALASRSTLFLDASSQAGWTKPSVPSFMTGTYPLQHGVYEGNSEDGNGVMSDVLGEDSITLAEVLSERGYRTGALVRNAHLREGMGIDQGFDTYTTRAGDASEIRRKAVTWLEEDDGEQPFFLYLHFLDAHWPYPVPSEYATLFAQEEDVELFLDKDWKELRNAINHGEVTLEPRQLEALLDLYDGSIRYIDDQIALLFEELERKGLAENTVICVVADHGEEFLEHGRIGHGHGLSRSLLHVPWILHVPGQGTEQVQNAVSLVDLFPTLLAATGSPWLGPSEGINRLAWPQSEAPILAEHKEPGAYLQSIREGSHKLIVRFEPPPVASSVVNAKAELESSLRGRWVEAGVDLLESDLLLATTLRSEKGEVGDPMEIKGLVEMLRGGSIALNGITVHLSARTKYYGQVLDSAGQHRDLVQGMMVKAKGAFREGVFHASMIKLYPSTAKVESEIRGLVEEARVTESGSRIRIGECWIQLDDRISIELEGDSKSRRRMTRSQIAELVGLGREGALAAGFTARVEFFDLLADPGESNPAVDPGPSALSRLLEETMSGILGRKVSLNAERISLNADDLDALAEIGYVE